MPANNFFLKKNVTSQSCGLSWLLACLIVASCGCVSTHDAMKVMIFQPRKFHEYKQSQILAEKSIQFAETAWLEMYGGRATSPDFQRGFIEGYADFIQFGGNGNPPALPPRDYWQEEYQNPQGQVAINEWFAGFREGAHAARASGLRSQVTIPVSGLAPQHVSQAEVHFGQTIMPDQQFQDLSNLNQIPIQNEFAPNFAPNANNGELDLPSVQDDEILPDENSSQEEQPGLTPPRQPSIEHEKENIDSDYSYSVMEQNTVMRGPLNESSAKQNDVAEAQTNLKLETSTPISGQPETKVRYLRGESAAVKNPFIKTPTPADEASRLLTGNSNIQEPQIEQVGSDGYQVVKPDEGFVFKESTRALLPFRLKDSNYRAKVSPSKNAEPPRLRISKSNQKSISKVATPQASEIQLVSPTPPVQGPNTSDRQITNHDQTVNSSAKNLTLRSLPTVDETGVTKRPNQRLSKLPPIEDESAATPSSSGWK